MRLLDACGPFHICSRREVADLTQRQRQMLRSGLSTSFWLSVLALFLSGMTDGISMIIRQTILQLRTPDHMRGRVSSVNSMFVGSSNELGAFESGLTAKLMGTVTAVVFGGSMTILTVLVTGFISPKFRKLDLRKDIQEQEEAA